MSDLTVSANSSTPPALRAVLDGRDSDALRRLLSAALAVPAQQATSDFDLSGGAPDGFQPRRAGVLAAFLPNGDLILTKRASSLRHHPGQIALPGGKVDPTDADEIAAALREAHEEVGLPPSRAEVLGTMPAHRTVTGFAMLPVIALVNGPFTPIPEWGEVDEVFTVPFRHIADPASYRLQSRDWRGEARSYHVAPWGPYYIWGATARVLYRLACRIEAAG